MSKKCTDPTEEVNVKVSIIDEVPLLIGLPGSKGNSGRSGDRGSPGLGGRLGRRGNRGLMGPMGQVGPQGDGGFLGPPGPMGVTGDKGPTGLARTWFVGGTGCTLTVTGPASLGNLGLRNPIPGDLLLNLEDCSVCIFNSMGEWVQTQHQLSPCLTCDQVEDCLKELKEPDNVCSLLLTLPNCPPLFFSGENYVIYSLIILGVPQIIPLTQFDRPNELAIILASLGFNTQEAFGTHFFIKQIITTDPDYATLENSITFRGVSSGNLIKHDFSLTCESEVCFACDKFSDRDYVLACLNNVNVTGSSGPALNPNANLVWVPASCLGVTGASGIPGPTGAMGLTGARGAQGYLGETGESGPTCGNVFDCLCELHAEKHPDCLYCGIISPGCLSFLNNVNATFQVATAFDLVIQNGPVSFSDQNELNFALGVLNIKISGNLLQVFGSDQVINQVIFYNLIGDIIAIVNLTSTLCCPTAATPKDLPILTRDVPDFPPVYNQEDLEAATGAMLWAPAECTLIPEFNLEQEICQLPPCENYKCCVEIDATRPFVQSGSNQHFPWKVSLFTLFGNNLTNSYAGKINNYKDWIAILQKNGWVLKEGTVSTYQQCIFSLDPQQVEESQNSYQLMDSVMQIFYCEEFEAECEKVDLTNLKFLIKDNGLVTGATAYQDCTVEVSATGSTGVTGVKLAPPEAFFDSITYCEDVIYSCTAQVQVDDFIDQITIGAAWEISNIVVAKINQPIVTTQFTSALQLETILTNLGWTSLGDGEFSLTLTLPVPSQQSWITIINGGGESQRINLVTTCEVDCSNLDIDLGTGVNRYIFTRIDACNYCWMHPNCFTDLVIDVECCPGLISSDQCPKIELDQVPDCQIVPKYDLRLELTHSVINLIKWHFKTGCKPNEGPYWIYGYKIFQGLDVVLQQLVLNPFTLQNFVRTLVETLGWISDPVWQNITDETKKVGVILNNSCDLITGLLINLNGENGQNGMPFNFVIPMHTIDRIECHDLPRDAKILLKIDTDFTGITGGCIPIEETGLTAGQESGLSENFAGTGAIEGFCFVDLDCVVPIVPPPINFEQEICDIDDCIKCCDGTAVPGFEGLTGCDCFETFIEASGLSSVGLTGFCPHQAVYTNCVRLDDCDIERLISIYGDLVNLQIIGYQLVNGKECNFEPPQDIGINPTFDQLLQAFFNVGWTTTQPLTDRPIQLMWTTCQNIKYIIINQEGADPNVPPYPYLIGANCIMNNDCPSTNAENMTMIKKPDNLICWTKICRIPGDRGDTGPMGDTGGIGNRGPNGFIGMTGSTGTTGPQGPIGDGGCTGSAGNEGNQGPAGNQGDSGEGAEQGNQGPQGFEGVASETGPQGEMGFPGNQGETGLEGLQGDTGLPAAGGVGISQDGANTGGAPGEFFVEVTGIGEDTFMVFRSLIGGENIDVMESGDEIDIAVSDAFDWGDTVFSGTPGADVASGSQLQFLAGSTLFTDIIEETTSGNGVKIDTSGVTGMTFKDGGINFSNDPFSGSDGPTMRNLFLEYYDRGCLETSWVISAGGPTITVQSLTTFYWERIGNMVNMIIPPIVLDVHPGGVTGTDDVIQSDVTLPEPIQTASGSEVHVQPYLFTASGSTGPITDTFERRYGACTIAVSGITLSYTLANSAGFPTTTQFLGAEGINVNYLIQ